jgi:cytochrome c oxidase subunit IV
MSSHPHTQYLTDITAAEVQKYHAFINLALFLSILTSAEIVMIFLPFSHMVLLLTLIAASIVKFFCVILWFMHLIYDKRLLLMIFAVGLIMAMGTIIALIAMLETKDLDRSRYALEASAQCTEIV